MFKIQTRSIPVHKPTDLMLLNIFLKLVVQAFSLSIWSACLTFHTQKPQLRSMHKTVLKKFNSITQYCLILLDSARFWRSFNFKSSSMYTFWKKTVLFHFWRALSPSHVQISFTSFRQVWTLLLRCGCTRL